MTDHLPAIPFRDILLCVFGGAVISMRMAVALETVPDNAGTAVVAETRPMIAIIIDDLGNQRLPGLRTIALDGPIACAIMPHTAHATYLAEHANAAGKEVILHMPMQPAEMGRIAGPGEISLDTDKAELAYILDQDLRSVPHAVGISNHMGSLITRHPGHMRWLMQELDRRENLYFIDSFTTPDSVAYKIAIEMGIPAARRHIFLDNEQTAEAVAHQFDRLKHRARAQGYAIGIGHPYPATLDYLQTALPALEDQGFQLVAVSRIVALLDSMQLPSQIENQLSEEDQNILVRAK